MATYVLGGVALTGAALYYYLRTASTGGGSDAPSAGEESSLVPHLKTAAELKSMLAKGGKAVVYLTASW